MTNIFRHSIGPAKGVSVSKRISNSAIIFFIAALAAVCDPGCKKNEMNVPAPGYSDVDIKDGIPTRIRFECTGKEYKTVDELLKTKKEDRYTYDEYVFNMNEFQFLKNSGFFIKPVELSQLYYPKRDDYDMTEMRYDDMVDLYLRYSRLQKPEEYFEGMEGFSPVYNIAPYFISADYTLHIFHLMFMRMMQSVEERKFYPALRDMTETMLADVFELYKNTSDPRLKEEMKKTAAFLLVPAKIMGVTPKYEIPEIDALVANDLKMIEAMQGNGKSAITGEEEDFSQYKPRGYYTLTENLTRYFKAMIWYGRMYFPEDKPVIPVILTSLLSKPENQKKWELIYKPTGYLIGKSEDFNLYQYQGIMKKVFGSTEMLKSYPDQGKLDEFIRNTKSLPGPKISNVPLSKIPDKEKTPAKNLEAQRGFRLMGQRFVPDAYIFSRLTSKNVGDNQAPRNTPKALDVMAILGSKEAEDLLQGDMQKIPNYRNEYNKLKDEFSKYGDNVWKQNAYYGWLYTFSTLFNKPAESLPFAFKTPEWRLRLLLTTHGSWAELKHDTLLYTKQSYGEAGGEGETRYFPGQPYIPRGYVEPNVKFFTALYDLTSQIRRTLVSMNMMTDQYEKRFTEYEKILDRMRNIAKKEISNDKISDEDFMYIAEFNTSIGSLILPEDTDYSAMKQKDKQMALISDVHTDNFFHTVLEAGVGIPQQLYVVVSDNNGLRVCVGYIYSYYEFNNPQDKRMTDDEWKEKVYKEGGWKALKNLEPDWIRKIPFSQ